MKNTVSERTGMKAYAMFTDDAIQAMQARETATCFVCHAESYEHLGAVPVYLYDLHPYWEKAEQQQREYVSPEAASAVAHIRVPAPPAVVWDIFTNPATRGQVVAGKVTASDLQNGRIGVGATYHCAHGDGTAIEEMVLDWKPFEYFTVEQAPDPKKGVLMTAHFEPRAEGQATRLTLTLALHMNGSTNGLVQRLLCKWMFGERGHGKDFARLARLVAEDYAREQAGEQAAEHLAAATA
jgi:uncharacterized protein YndB with AHSA1/START domain